jgi:hypothetical protein
VVRDFQNLAFDDAADAIQISAAFALHVVRMFRLAAKPEDESHYRQDGEARERKPFVPVFQDFFQQVPSRKV